MKELKLPSSDKVNLYNWLKEHKGESIPALDELTEEDIQKILTNIDKTLTHFDTPPENWNGRGDLLIRFALLMSIQDDDFKITIDDNNPTLSFITDMWEYFNRLD